MEKSFLVLFSKKNEHFFLKKEAKIFIHKKVLYQPAHPEQRRRPRRTPAEFDVELHRIARIAGLEHALQAGRRFRMKGIAGLGESVKTVGVEHFGPQVGIVASRVAAAAKQMLEMRRAVTHADFGRHAEAGEGFGFEGLDVQGFRRGVQMQLHVQDGAGEEFDGGKTLVEGAGGEQAVDQVVGDGLAGFVVAGVSAQSLRRLQPVFVDL